MDEYFAEWNSGHISLLFIYKKIRPLELPADIYKDGCWLNYIYQNVRFPDKEYKKTWFIVDVIYSSVTYDYPDLVIARIDLQHDKCIEKVSHAKAMAMIL